MGRLVIGNLEALPEDKRNKYKFYTSLDMIYSTLEIFNMYMEDYPEKYDYQDMLGLLVMEYYETINMIGGAKYCFITDENDDYKGVVIHTPTADDKAIITVNSNTGFITAKGNDKYMQATIDKEMFDGFNWIMREQGVKGGMVYKLTIIVNDRHDKWKDWKL